MLISFTNFLRWFSFAHNVHPMICANIFLLGPPFQHVSSFWMQSTNTLSSERFFTCPTSNICRVIFSSKELIFQPLSNQKISSLLPLIPIQIAQKLQLNSKKILSFFLYGFSCAFRGVVFEIFCWFFRFFQRLVFETFKHIWVCWKFSDSNIFLCSQSRGFGLETINILFSFCCSSRPNLNRFSTDG